MIENAIIIIVVSLGILLALDYYIISLDYIDRKLDDEV